MKLSITAKLFAAVLTTAMAVAVAMGAAAHFNLKRGFLGYLNEQAVQRLDLSLPGVTEGYRRNGSWQFLRDQPDLWYRLLRPLPPDDVYGSADAPPARPIPSPGELTGANRRFTLFDADRQRVAGLERWAPDAVQRAVVVDGRTVGWLAMSPFQSVSSAAETRFADGQTRASLLVGVGAVLLAAGVALWASRVLLTPVKRVAEATHRLAAGDYGTRVHLGSHDEVGALAYRKSELDVTELLRSTAAAFGERLASSELRIELREPATPLIVFGDERRLQQLFNNLFENSCRYTDAGGILIVSSSNEPTAEGRRIVIEFIDSSPGVNAEQLVRIFDRFYRGEASRNRGSGGAGLGLSISRRIVEAHDGEITARHSPLGGLWLSIRLPAASA